MHSCPLVAYIQVSAWQISLLLTLLQGDMEAAKKKSHVTCKGFASKKTVGLPWWASLQNKRYDFSRFFRINIVARIFRAKGEILRMHV